jgi:uncharacterized spore protein YtfJ
MNDKTDAILAEAARSQEQANQLMEKLFTVARPEAVYGQPLASGDYTTITASEVMAGMGVGYGVGGGTAPGETEGEVAVPGASESEGKEAGGFGGGGGGGGFSMGRPVAVISIGPQGVRVEPVVDVTKVALAFITAVGSMLIMMGRMAKGSRR